MGSQRDRLYLPPEAYRSKSRTQEIESGGGETGHTSDSWFGGKGSSSGQNCGSNFKASVDRGAGVHHLRTGSCAVESGRNCPRGPCRPGWEDGGQGSPTPCSPLQPGRGIRGAGDGEGDGRSGGIRCRAATRGGSDGR